MREAFIRGSGRIFCCFLRCGLRHQTEQRVTPTSYSLPAPSDSHKMAGVRGHCLGSWGRSRWDFSPAALATADQLLWSSFLFAECLALWRIIFFCSLTMKCFQHNLSLTNCIGGSCWKNLVLLFPPADFSGSERNMQLKQVGCWSLQGSDFHMKCRHHFSNMLWRGADGAWDVLCLGWISWI